MLSTKGLRWSSQHTGTGRRRIEKLAARQFSSSTVQNGPIRASPLLSQGRFAISRQSTRIQFSKGSPLIRNGATIRFASTAPISTQTTNAIVTPAASTSTPEVAAGTTPFADFLTPLDNTLSDIAVSPNAIGYLESLGLDYSVFRPTGGMTWVLEHMYVYTGLPWWAVIGLSAAAVRILFFKIFVNAAKNSAKMHAIQPIVKPLTEKMTAAARAKDNATVLHLRRQIKEINSEAGVKLSRSFLPALQIFPASGTFFTLRMMSNVPVPALETGGILWFQNLTLADPYFILPIATSFMLYRSLKKGGEAATAATQTPAMQQAFQYGLPAISLIFTSFMPAGIQLSFLVSGFGSYIQSTLNTQAWFRKYYNMTPVPPKPAPSIVDESGNPVAPLSPIAKMRQHGANIKEAASGVRKSIADNFPDQEVEGQKRRAAAYEARRSKEIAEEKRLAQIAEAAKRRNRKKNAKKAAQ